MLRIGAVSYLNTKPLIYGLRERLESNQSGVCGQLSLNLPSRLATQLRVGELDVALIPSVEYFRGQSDYQIVSDAAIACRGPVWSVRLLSRVPVRKIKRLALDEGSRTSVALTKVLLWEMYALRPETVPLTMEQTPEAVDADAVLVIGDRAMHPEPGVYSEIWDLGDRWCRWSELPFVFAMWVARRGVDIDRLAELLQQSRDEGVANLESIAGQYAAPHGLTNEDLHHYFADNLHYHLGPREQSGLELFRSRCSHLGLIADETTAAGAENE
ncbi:menaquinone biosynthetic enzyme MqnA/MqnD family protein [Stieleria varia]|uniref:Chorismate dehydratase n=1 Tax=Stieleria varia TaxID=2528005 RepID=A0A5C6B3B1_9BACT|nr:menaquinone biosynthesis protein [Stieleria varia]TWU05766.1 Chorismate dehydratase [Stieleria varia]